MSVGQRSVGEICKPIEVAIIAEMVDPAARCLGCLGDCALAPALTNRALRISRDMAADQNLRRPRDEI
jgi:hypothetical protein